MLIIAVDNTYLEEKIKEEYYLKYEVLILHTKDALMALSEEYENSILVLKDNIKGNVSIESVIKYVKDLNYNIQIIYITQNLTKEYKEYLFSKEIFNIIEGENISISSVIECINAPKMVIYKKEEATKKYNTIIIIGARDSGKTVSALSIAKTIAKKCKGKTVLLIDLDFQNPGIYLYLKGQKNYSFHDLINDFSNSNIKAKVNYETEDEKCKNLKYIVNKSPMNPPETKTILSLIEMLSSTYDYLVVDTSTFFMNQVYKTNDYKIVHTIKGSMKGYKDYLEDTMTIQKEKVEKAIKLITFKTIKNRLKNIKSNSYIKLDFRLLYNDEYKYNNMLYSINEILKELNIIKFKNIKQKIINKLLQIGEDSNEK